MTNLYLIRHADYIYDLDDGKYPKRDKGLSPEGVLQAGLLRNRLADTGEIKPDIFISSPQRRAHETARTIEHAVGIPITLDKDFEEWRSEDGSLTTEEFMEAWERLTDAQRPYYRWVEGCETMLEFSVRVCAALNRVLDEHSGKTILVLSHGAFIQTTFAYFFGYSLAIPQRAIAEIRHTSITHWVLSPKGKWILERSNDCQHLNTQEVN
jgi:probable phosphoglycerate mutase